MGMRIAVHIDNSIYTPLVIAFLTQEGFEAFESKDSKDCEATVKCRRKRVNDESLLEMLYEDSKGTVVLIPNVKLKGFLNLLAEEIVSSGYESPTIKVQSEDINGNSDPAASANWGRYQLIKGIFGWRVHAQLDQHYQQTFEPARFDQGRRVGELETEASNFELRSAAIWTTAATIAAYTTLLARGYAPKDIKALEFMQTKSGQHLTGMKEMLVLGLRHRNQFDRWKTPNVNN